MYEQIAMAVVPDLSTEQITTIQKRIARRVRGIGNEMKRIRWERKEDRYHRLSCEEILELSELTGIKFTDLVLKDKAGYASITLADMDLMYQAQGDSLQLGEVEVTA